MEVEVMNDLVMLVELDDYAVDYLEVDKEGHVILPMRLKNTEKPVYGVFELVRVIGKEKKAHE